MLGDHHTLSVIIEGMSAVSHNWGTWSSSEVGGAWVMAADDCT